MRWFACLLLLVTVWAPAHAQTFPKPNNTRVVDAANLLAPADESALDAILAAYEKETGRQLVVVTIPSLEGYPIEDYGYRLGRTWGIGSKEKDDGALLIVAPNDRKVRIEVGYGLEPILTDAYSSVIVNTQIVPRFKAGDFTGGINAGADAMIAQLKLTPEEAAARLKAEDASRSDRERDGRGGGIPIALIVWMVVMFFITLPGLLRSKRGRRHRGMGPIVIWGPGDWGGGSGGGWGGGGGGFGGFSGGGGSFGGGGSSGSW